MPVEDIRLFVILIKDGAQRSWELGVAPTTRGWAFRTTAPNQVTLGGLATYDEAVQKRMAFEQEIAEARRDGWQEKR